MVQFCDCKTALQAVFTVMHFGTSVSDSDSPNTFLAEKKTEKKEETEKKETAVEDSEEESAARKIQAGYRGMKTRRRLKARKQGKLFV